MDSDRNNVDLTEAISVTIGDQPMKVKDAKLGICTVEVTPTLLQKWRTNEVPAVRIEFPDHIVTFGSDLELNRVFRSVRLG